MMLVVGHVCVRHAHDDHIFDMYILYYIYNICIPIYTRRVLFFLAPCQRLRNRAFRSFNFWASLTRVRKMFFFCFAV